MKSDGMFENRWSLTWLTMLNENGRFFCECRKAKRELKRKKLKENKGTDYNDCDCYIWKERRVSDVYICVLIGRLGRYFKCNW